MTYFDYNATAPLDARVLTAMLPFLEAAGNPSSVHRYGRFVRDGIDMARRQLAHWLQVLPEQIIFTSGGTEANNMAICGVGKLYQSGALAVSNIEHESVLASAHWQGGQAGWTCQTILADDNSWVSVEAVDRAVTPATRLVSVMMANNETGVVQPVADIAEFLKKRSILLHTDAVQAAGKIPFTFQSTGAQLLTLSAHKIGGPKGVGALIVDSNLSWPPLLLGGGQERNLRSGTEFAAGIVGFGCSVEVMQQELDDRIARMQRLRTLLEGQLVKIPQVKILAEHNERLPNTCMLQIEGMTGEMLLMQLDKAGFAVGSGSACGSMRGEPSHVMLAMGLDDVTARQVIRISLGWQHTEVDVLAFVAALEKILA